MPAESTTANCPPATPQIDLRRVQPDDDRFLSALFASTRIEELAPVPWTEEQKAQFLAMQFRAQTLDYDRNYPAASRDVILVDGEAAGRLYVDRREEAIHIIDIALLPRFRGQGVGTHLLQHLLDEGDRTGLPVSIHVEVHNPARRLYDRLGFLPVEENGIYLLMRRELNLRSAS